MPGSWSTVIAPAIDNPDGTITITLSAPHLSRFFRLSATLQ